MIRNRMFMPSAQLSSTITWQSNKFFSAEKKINKSQHISLMILDSIEQKIDEIFHLEKQSFDGRN